MRPLEGFFCPCGRADFKTLFILRPALYSLDSECMTGSQRTNNANIRIHLYGGKMRACLGDLS